MVAYPIKHRFYIMEGKLITLWLAAIWIVNGLISVLPQVHIHGRNIVQNFGVIIVTLSAIMYSSTYYKLKKQSKDLCVICSNESRTQAIRILKQKRFFNTLSL